MTMFPFRAAAANGGISTRRCRFVPGAVAVFALTAAVCATAAAPAHAQKGLPFNRDPQMSVAIEGFRQGGFGGPTVQIPILKYDFNVVSPVILGGGGGQQTGKRQYAPIVFQKLWDASTVQINRALVTGERLRSVTFTFFELNARGAVDVSFKVILRNAVFVSIHQHVGDTLKDDSLNPQRLEEIGVAFESISIEDPTNISSDSLNQQSSVTSAAPAVSKPRSGAATTNAAKITPRPSSARRRVAAVSALPAAPARRPR